MSQQKQTNDHEEVNIDIESQKNAKNERSTKRLKETQSIRTIKDRSRIIWIILKITSLAVIAFIAYKNYCLVQTVNQQSINETQRKLEGALTTSFSAYLKKEFDYNDVELKGWGKYGIVFEADGVAIKLVRDEAKPADELILHQAACQIDDSSDAVVRVLSSQLETFEHDNKTWRWFKMELMEEDLLHFFERGDALTDDQIWDWIQIIEPFLKKFNDDEMMHTDIKFENLMIKEGKIKLCDFGCGKNASIWRESPNGSGTITSSSQLNDMQNYADWNEEDGWVNDPVKSGEMKRQIEYSEWSNSKIAHYVDEAGYLDTLIKILFKRCKRRYRPEQNWFHVLSNSEEQLTSFVEILREENVKSEIVTHIEQKIRARISLEMEFEEIWTKRRREEKEKELAEQLQKRQPRENTLPNPPSISPPRSPPTSSKMTPLSKTDESCVSKPLPSIIAAIVIVVVVFFMY